MQRFKGLQGKVALVTGASTGIGAATAIKLAQQGAKVAVNYLRSEDDAEKVLKTIMSFNGDAMLVKADVTSSEEVNRMVARVVSTFGTVHILINNAGGIPIRQTIKEMDEGLWDRTLALNLKSAFLCSKAVIPYLEGNGWGRVVNISSVAARMGGGEGAVAYAAAKAGLIGFTKGLARELAPYGVTVNAVAPGLVDTPFHIKAKTNIEKLLPRVILGRMARADEVASLISFLCSEEASYITGEVIYVSGGFF